MLATTWRVVPEECISNIKYESPHQHHLLSFWKVLNTVGKCSAHTNPHNNAEDY